VRNRASCVTHCRIRSLVSNARARRKSKSDGRRAPVIEWQTCDADRMAAGLNLSSHARGNKAFVDSFNWFAVAISEEPLSCCRVLSQNLEDVLCCAIQRYHTRFAIFAFSHQDLIMSSSCFLLSISRKLMRPVTRAEQLAFLHQKQIKPVRFSGALLTELTCS